MKIKNLLAILIFSLSSGAHAEFYAKDYIKLKDSETFRAYVNGLGVGYGWANAHLSSNKKRPLYCEPRSLALNADNYMRILDDGLTKIPGHGDTPIEYILLLQLQKTFPCN